jgi:hypothetical protein
LASLYFQSGRYEKAIEEIELMIPKTSGEARASLEGYLEIMKKEVEGNQERIREAKMK